MSMALQRHIKRTTASKGSARLVLLELADYANLELMSWPSVLTLAQGTGLSVRSVQYALRTLEDDLHEIVTVRGNGRGHLAKYRLVLKSAPVGEERVQTLHPLGGEKGANLAPIGEERVQTVHPLDEERVQNTPIKGAKSAPEVKALQATTNNQQQQQKPPPPPISREDFNDGGGGGDEFSFLDEESGELIEELEDIAGRLATNHEKTVLRTAEYGQFRRRALLELRRDWVTIKLRRQVSFWLVRVIERLIVEHQRSQGGDSEDQRRKKYADGNYDGDTEAARRSKYVPDWQDGVDYVKVAPIFPIQPYP